MQLKIAATMEPINAMPIPIFNAGDKDKSYHLLYTKIPYTIVAEANKISEPTMHDRCAYGYRNLEEQSLYPNKIP